MVGKLLTSVVGLITTALGGFVVIAVLVYFANGGGGAGQAAVADMTRQAIGLATVLIRGVVDLVQASFSAATEAIR